MLKSLLSRLTLTVTVGIAFVATSVPLNPGGGWFNGYWPGYIGMLLIFFYPTLLHAADHASRIDSGERIVHWKENLKRAPFILLVCYVINAYNFDWLRFLPMLGGSLAWFGLVFNYCLNYYRMLPFDYISKKDENSAFTDSLFNNFKHGGLILIFLELFILCLTFALYVL
jgi:hypothetical protein